MDLPMKIYKNYFFERYWLAWLLLFAGLMATAAATYRVKSDVESDEKAEFSFDCSQIRLRTESRMRAQAQLLTSAAATFDISDRMTRERFHAFIQQLHIEQNFPGIQSISFSEMIPRKSLAEHIQEIHNQGFPDYEVRPEGNRESFSPVIWIEPFSGQNTRVFGYDTFFEPVRRAAMEQARDLNAPVLSGKIILVQETGRDVQAGTLMFVPVYRAGMPADTVAERRAALYGWVSCAYRMNDLMQGILGGWDSADGKRIRLQIFDNGLASDDSLLYDSHPQQETAAPRLTLQIPVTFNGRTWLILFSQIDVPSIYGPVYGMALGGALASLLMFGLAFSLFNTRIKAQNLADQLTRNIRESEEKYRVIFNNETYAIAIIDFATLRVLDVNDVCTRMYGYSREELLSSMILSDITTAQDSADVIAAHIDNMDSFYIPLRYHRKKDGTVFPVEIVGGLFTWKGRKAVFGLAHDITARKTAEDRLHKIMGEQQIILDTVDIGISLIKDRKQVWVNRKTMDMFHYTREELEGQTTRKLYPSQKAYEQLGRDAHADLSQGRVYETEQQLIRRDRALIWVKYIGKAVDPPDLSKGIIWLMDDITERRQAEDTLRESEERYRTVAYFTYEWEYWTSPDRGFIYCSPACERVTGYRADEFENTPDLMRSIIHPDDYDQFTHHLNTVDNPGEDFHEEEFRIFTRSGEMRWIAHSCRIVYGDDGTYRGRRASNRDITERKQMEETLRKSEERLTLALKATHDAVWDWDLLTQTCYYSSRWWRIAGYEENELTDGPDLWRRLMRPEDWERSCPDFCAAITREPSFGVETRLLHKDGHDVPIHIQGYILRDDNGKPIRISGTITDLTEQIMTEMAHREREWQRHQLRKADSLKRMAGAIAHHFNNQLQVVMGYLEMCMDGLLNGTEAQSSLGKAMQASERAAGISRQMLLYLGELPGKHALHDFSDICRQSLSLFLAEFPKGLTVDDDFPSPGPVIRANAAQVQQVVVGLVSNAREAMGDNPSAVRVSVRTVSPGDIPARHRFPIGWQPQDMPYACVEVADTGCGIPDHDIGKIFDPFFSTKFTGRGMGLSVAMGIMRAHLGGITVDSEPGKGSIFQVYLPASAEAIPVPLKRDPGTLKVEGKTAVLVVEDEELVLNIVSTMLKRYGFTVFEAKDGAEAVELFRQHPNEISCVLSDLVMPRMDGWELVTALRMISPGIPVILTSGHDEAEMMADDHPDHPDAFLAKPYELKNLVNTIHQLL